MKIVKAPHPSSGHYSAAVISNGMVYVSGQSAADPFDGIVKVQGIAAGVRQSLTRIENILKEAGIDRTHIVFCRVFVTDIAKWKEANEAYAEFFGDHKPARAVYAISEIHHGDVEIEAVAEL